MFGFVEILLLIGAFHGFFLGSILAFKQNGDHAANRLFAALLLITSWQLFLTALSKSGVLVQVPHLAGTAFPFMFLVGPLYYFYAKKLTHGAFGFKGYDVLHLIPFLYVVWSFFPYYLTDHAIKAEALAAQHLTEPSLSASMLLYVLGNLLLAVSYFFAAHRLIARKVQSFKDMASDHAALSSLSRLRRLTQGYALYLLGLALTITLLFFFDAYNDAIDTAWVLTKSLFIHAIGYVAIVQPVYFWAAMPGQPFHAPVSSEVPPEKEQQEEDKYQKSGLADEQAASYHDQLLHLMDEHTPYLDSDLTLHQLATVMSISPNQLSQVINQQAGMNFYDFINQYRVEHAKRLLLDETVDYIILAIALESGFNSKSTFNRVFKKHTGMTPTAFKARRLAAAEHERDRATEKEADPIG